MSRRWSSLGTLSFESGMDMCRAHDPFFQASRCFTLPCLPNYHQYTTCVRRAPHFQFSEKFHIFILIFGQNVKSQDKTPHFQGKSAPLNHIFWKPMPLPLVD